MGPILFLILINSISGHQGVQKKLFADDIKFYQAFSECPITGNVLQEALDDLSDRAISCGLSLNPKKCSTIHFCRKVRCTHPKYFLNGEELPAATEATDLGITIDPTLRFHSHIRNISNKAKGFSCNILRRTVNRKAPFMLEVFDTYIRPLVEFATPLWNTGYIADSRKLESVQRKWTAQITGFENLPYNERLERFDLYSLKGRRTRYDLIKVWKILHSKSPIPPYLILQKARHPNTRGHPLKLFIPYVKLEARKRSFPHRVLSLWNSLPADVACATSMESFKRGLHENLQGILTGYDDWN